MTTHRRVVQIGNFRPDHSTENHLARALEAAGHTVERCQEDDSETWAKLANVEQAPDASVPDLVLWTRTWHLPQFPQAEALAACKRRGVPTVAYHLDRWWGLAREHQVSEEPFFRCDVVVTADGGHDDAWAAAGVRHWWAPPAVLGAEAMRTGRVREYRGRRMIGPERGAATTTVPPIIFVGSWSRYHDEWPWRRVLVNNLMRTYGRDFGVFPRLPGRAVRGQDLADLYAAAQIVVGDSCLAGGAARYWSDRIPETLGRGAFLIHPDVAGIADHYQHGEHLVLCEPESWDAMRLAIDSYMHEPEERARIAADGRAHVLAHHTYEQRMAWLFARLEDDGLMSPLRGGAGRVRVTTGDLGPAEFDLRPGSTDGLTVAETWDENVYDLTPEDVAGKVVLDLGANIGAFSVWAAMAGAERVLAIEPDVGNADQCANNHAANPVAGHVTVATAAVGATTTRATIDVEPGLEACATVKATGGTGPVAVYPLRTFVGMAGGHVHVVKIDVEGAEYEALTTAGQDGTLAHVDRIVGEWHPWDGDPRVFGAWVAALLDHGTLRIFGHPGDGGQFEWRRYGA